MEAYILIITLVLIICYIFRPITKNEKKNLESLDNWKSGF